ncbi:MAG: hypothetical protein A2289_17385 [Deltaproteobacteria bacterium RIFOXYA12_FULL_58_15]|nr:MAG: hypothetical protein A2289_17385 [Deltaproteobacteria bacterium RIFOXYA12_FULL_58_15]
MALDEPKDGDEEIEVGGITWLVAQKDASYVLAGDGVRIDHLKQDWGAWFQVTRVNQVGGGCC